MIEMSPAEQRRFPSNLHVGRIKTRTFAGVSATGEMTLTGRSSRDPFVAEPRYLEDMDNN